MLEALYVLLDVAGHVIESFGQLADFGGTADFGHFLNAGTVATQLGRQLGSAAGTIFTELAGVVPGWAVPDDPVPVFGLLVAAVFGRLLVGLVMNLLLESKSGPEAAHDP